MRHDGNPAVGAAQCGDAQRRAVRIERIRCAGCSRLSTYCNATSRCVQARRRSIRASNSAWPSPCATAIGSTEPCMPANSTDGDGGTRTRRQARLNCSDRLRTKRGQPSAPGISSLSARNIWQPLQTPKVKVSVRAKKRANSLARRRVEQDRLRPALAGAQHVAVGKAAAGHQPVKPSRAYARRPADRSCARRSASKPAGSNTAAISVWLLTPCSRRMATRGPRAARNERRGDILAADRSSSATCRPGSAASRQPAKSSRAHCGSSRSSCMRNDISLQRAAGPGAMRNTSPGRRQHIASASSARGAPMSRVIGPDRGRQHRRAPRLRCALAAPAAPRPAPRQSRQRSGSATSAEVDGRARSGRRRPSRAAVTSSPPSDRSW